MNKYSKEQWDYYSYNPENITLNGLEYAVKIYGGKEDGSDDRAVTNNEELARLIAAAPDMYELLSKLASLPDESCMISPLILEARRILDHIAGESEADYES